MADFSAIRPHFESNNLPYFTFYPKSQKPEEVVIRQLAVSTPAEDIADGWWTMALTLLASHKCQPPVDHLKQGHPQ
jgi:hypothetical protein